MRRSRLHAMLRFPMLAQCVDVQVPTVPIRSAIRPARVAAEACGCALGEGLV